jgi:hypothetical protein
MIRLRTLLSALPLLACALCGCSNDFRLQQLAPNLPGLSLPSTNGVLWRNGGLGKFNGASVALSAAPNEIPYPYSVVNATDTVNGDGEGLLVSNNCGCNSVSLTFNFSVPVNVAAYTLIGSIQFDLEGIQTDGTDFLSAVSYTDGSSWGNCNTGLPLQLGGGFTHYSLPLSSFSTTTSYTMTQFTMTVTTGNSYLGAITQGPYFIANNIQWTLE